jgi:hypothetical protein
MPGQCRGKGRQVKYPARPPVKVPRQVIPLMLRPVWDLAPLRVSVPARRLVPLRPMVLPLLHLWNQVPHPSLLRLWIRALIHPQLRALVHHLHCPLLRLFPLFRLRIRPVPHRLYRLGLQPLHRLPPLHPSLLRRVLLVGTVAVTAVIAVRIHAEEDGYGDHAMPDDLLIDGRAPTNKGNIKIIKSRLLHSKPLPLSSNFVSWRGQRWFAPDSYCREENSMSL